MTEEPGTSPVKADGSSPAGVEGHVTALYGELRRIAHELFRGERAEHTLQPTALVHEVYLRLVRDHGESVMQKQQFMVYASVAMRRVLIEHARHHNTEKRGGGRVRISLDESLSIAGRGEIDVVMLNEVLDKFESFDPDSAKLVNLRFFGGAKVEEVAQVLGISKSKAEKDWKAARAWLARELGVEGLADEGVRGDT